MTQYNQLPRPKTYGPLGNLPALDKEKPVQTFMKMAKELGPIYQFEFPGRTSTFVSSAELAAEICDEKRFDKSVGPALQKVRAFGGDGLFTSETSEPNWKKAHQILLPSFSQQAMKGYHDKMLDLATQLVQKWERLNASEEIDVPEDMTRLTLDTIGLCGFNFRFNSFYREDMHPFVEKMVRALDESMSQTQRLPFQDKLMLKTKKQFEADIDDMFKLADELIAERKRNGDNGENDLLSHMLEGKDPETGEGLSDENIRYQMLTFLIAGHETTSGLLSFALYFLMKNPDKLQKAYEEVDAVLGDDVPDYKQVKQLKYARMILNETLRLWPTAPAFTVYAKEDTTLAGKYSAQKGEVFTLLTPELHRDTAVWGEDVEAFCPERFEDPSKIPHHAFKPFGNGQRACIGQQFAMHEATIVLGMVLQQFELIDHTNYELDVKETLTLKPEGLTMKVRPRVEKTAFYNPEAKGQETKAHDTPAITNDGHGTPLLFLYASNMGTAEGVARELAEKASSLGFATDAAPLDSRTGDLPEEGAVIFVSASYNGHPPDNAVQFMEWISTAEEGALNGVSYTVFGCGDRNWATTYQKVPQEIDRYMEAKGAERIVPRGEGDAGDDFDGDLEKWQEKLWDGLAAHFELEVEAGENSTSSIALKFVSGTSYTPVARAYDAFTSEVAANRELQKSGSRSTRHLDIKLPDGVTYQEGDHLGVLPENGEELLARVCTRFDVKAEDYVLLEEGSGKAKHLPSGQPIKLGDLLASHVELQEPATRAQIRALAACNPCPPHKVELEELLEDETYKSEVLKKRRTMLELLEIYPSSMMEFDQFLALLPALKVRYYSISSSPAKNDRETSITVSVVEDEAWSGTGIYKGVSSNYLADRKPGDRIACFIRTPETAFHLPESLETPIIMVGPGTGVAPFRGFLQKRSLQKQAGETLGEAHLYFGCRHPEEDYLYEEELQAAEAEGIVTLHTVFSRVGAEKCYVQHIMEEDAAKLVDLLDNGAHLYICGDGSRMAPDVTAMLQRSYQHIHDTDEQTAVEWLNQLEKEGRFAKDVWAGA